MLAISCDEATAAIAELHYAFDDMPGASDMDSAHQDGSEGFGGCGFGDGGKKPGFLKKPGFWRRL